MSVVDGGGSASGLIQRVQDILLRPGPTWEKIEAEPATVQGLYAGYIALLALIIPVCTLLVLLLISPLFGFAAPFVLAGAIIQAVTSYALSLLGVYVFALAADALAGSFGATRGVLPALKVAAYGMTAVWVSGLCLLIPLIGILGVLAGCVYSIWLIHMGLARLMKPAADKAVIFTAVTVLATGVAMALVDKIVDIIT